VPARTVVSQQCLVWFVWWDGRWFLCSLFMVPPFAGSPLLFPHQLVMFPLRLVPCVLSTLSGPTCRWFHLGVFCSLPFWPCPIPVPVGVCAGSYFTRFPPPRVTRFFPVFPSPLRLVLYVATTALPLFPSPPLRLFQPPDLA